VPLKDAKKLQRPDFSRKEKIAEWVTAPGNPWFAKAAANRVWGQFFRRGLVHPVDNLSDRAAASQPALLDRLAKELATRKFDLKWLIREIVSSPAYQLASAGKNPEPEWHEQMRLRPLSAEEMLAAMRVATGFDAAARLAGAKPGQEKLPSGLESYFVRHFGTASDGRGDFQASLTERLFVSNNAALRQLIQRRKGNLADELLSSKAPWPDRVERLFLTVLSRQPKAAERERFAAHLTSQADAAPLVEEAIWALLASAEFRFNH
jgi:hypothetical protein